MFLKACVFLAAVTICLVLLPWFEMRYLPWQLHEEFPPGVLSFLFLLFGFAVFYRRRMRKRPRLGRFSRRGPD